MLSFLSWFLLFNLLYHVFATRTVFWLGLWSASMPTFIREGLWCLFIAVLFLSHIKQWKAYRNRWKRSWISLGGLLIFSVIVSYLGMDKGRGDILIGIKYGFRWLIILLASTGIGFFYREKFKNPKLWKYLLRGLVWTVAVGFLRQGLKLLRPDFFSWIGYELHLNDRQFDQKPPLYYLTGWEGTLRRQGLFSGPNNYGYFLVAFFPVILSFTRQHRDQKASQRLKLGILFIWILAMLMTLSRAVILWGILVLFLTYRSTLKKNKKLLRGAGIAIVLAFLGLSVLKWDSTLVHITSKLGAIPQIIQQPLGYGLGSSGPAIHHNGTMLPENYYFEILLDTGTIGLILWAIVIFQLIGMQAMLRKQGLTTPESVQIQRGLLALLLIGFVLHVFEDSMVNYLFFTIYGILLWCLSREIKGNVWFFIPWSWSSDHKAP